MFYGVFAARRRETEGFFSKKIPTLKSYAADFARYHSQYCREQRRVAENMQHYSQGGQFAILGRVLR